MSRERWRNDRRRTGDPNVRAAKSEAYLDKVESLIEERIRAAQEEGQFDNLPGHGKPLHMDSGYDLDSGYWMANRVLKGAGFVPDWVELRKEIAAERDEVKRALETYREHAEETLNQTDPVVTARLQVLEDRYVLLATAINAKIDQHNSRCPASQTLTRFVEDAPRRWT